MVPKTVQISEIVYEQVLWKVDFLVKSPGGEIVGNDALFSQIIGKFPLKGNCSSTHLENCLVKLQKSFCWSQTILLTKR
jgi:hypothetical protein